VHSKTAASLSPTRRPPELDPVAWQAQLRRQFGRAQSFEMKNLGTESIFSEFRVTNPQTQRSYRVAIRGSRPGDNFCACADFATNQLGTCKHIEYVLARLERKRGAKQALADGFRPEYSEIHLSYGGERQVRFRAGTTCSPALARRAHALFELAAASGDFEGLEALIEAAHAQGHELRCYEDALHFIAQRRDGERRRTLLDSAYPQGAASPALQALLNEPLYPYQAQGALFAARAGRCLIGDEMGLGKTVQAIAATELLAQHCGVQRVLIICPTSLKYQWRREITRFSGREASVNSGSRAARMSHFAEPGFCKITNYEKLESDLQFIQDWDPDLVIVDEAQRIKNWNTHAARALKRIESPYAIVLTGTPLENRLEELISIVEFVDLYRLGPTWRLRQEHQVLDDGGRVIGYRQLDQLAKTLQPVLIRRRKAEVLEQLPARVDKTLFVNMTPQQHAEHGANAAVVQRIVQRWRKTGYLSDVDQRRLMAALQNMRMSCDSTYLLDGKTEHGLKVAELLTQLEEIFEQPHAKVVIFSQWLRMHELIARHVQQRGWEYVLFNGRVPAERRAALIERFTDDPACRIFLSTDAGSVGLNLQHAASIVINMDLPWNPAVLEQRIGRVHRLGQRRGVQVVNFVAAGTIEEAMLSVLAFKKSLFAGVLDGGEREVFLGGSRLKQFMESVDAVANAPLAAEEKVGTSEVESARNLPQAAAVAAAPEVPMATVLAAASDAPPQPTESAASVASAENPWTPLLHAGVQLLQALAATHERSDKPAAHSLVDADPATGQRYLRLPLPEPQMIQQLSDSLTRLIAGFSKT
jgi:superfamily II DNA or RNA helicase